MTKHLPAIFIATAIVCGLVATVVVLTMGRSTPSSSPGPTSPAVAPTPPPPVVPTPPPVPTPAGCSGTNGASSKRISGAWVNSANGEIIDGAGFANIPTLDVIFLSSFNPDPRVDNCSGALNNDPLAAAGNVSFLKSGVDVIRLRQPQAKILLSVGGSSFGLPSFCAMLAPFLNGTNCTAIETSGGGGTNLCDDSHANTQTPVNSTCAINGTATQGGYFTYNKGWGCPNGTCYCCCSYNYVLNADPRSCTSNIPPPPPSTTTCDYTTYPDTQDGTAKLMSDILAGSGADGFDFDFENPDPGGYVAAAFIPFAKAIKAHSNARTPPRTLVFSITMMSGNNMEYAGLYECFRSSDCPFDYAVPMPYPNCMYPYTGSQVYKDVWDNATKNWTQTSPINTGFTWDGLMDGWTHTYFRDESVTQLIMAVTTLQHYDWFPCRISNLDIDHVYTLYTNHVKLGACTHVVGLFFFWYLQFSPDPTYDANVTSASIRYWQNLISTTHTPSVGYMH